MSLSRVRQSAQLSRCVLIWAVRSYGINGYNGAYAGDSTNNSMFPNLIQTGIELLGSSGGYALQAQYSTNLWSDGNNYHDQTNDGVNGPPGQSNDTSEVAWGWVSGQRPSNPNSNGGTWYTRCGC